MEQTAGLPDITIGLLDGPVDHDHPDLREARIRDLSTGAGSIVSLDSVAGRHGTLVAGTLVGARGTSMAAICPGCTLLVRPIFTNTAAGDLPTATPDDLAAAIVESVDAGATVLNVSAGIAAAMTPASSTIAGALTYAAHRSVLVVAAAGNQGAVGGSAITRHPWVIPVAACDRRGRPADYSNLGRSIATGGLLAPGEGITGLTSDGEPLTFSGTSVATPLVTGAIALLWSLRPDLSAAGLRAVLTAAGSRRPATVVPPLLNAWAAYEMIAAGVV